MEWVQVSEKEWTACADMIYIKQCPDGSWRAGGYPYHDKVRNLKSREDAEKAALEWYEEYKHCFPKQ